MRIKSLLSFLLVINALLIQAQTISSFTLDADSVFQNLDKSLINTDVLYDRVYPYAMLHIFNTTYFDTTNVHHFKQGYYELYHASYNNTNLISPGTLDRKIEAITRKGRVPIGIINFQFNQIDTN